DRAGVAREGERLRGAALDLELDLDVDLAPRDAVDLLLVIAGDPQARVAVDLGDLVALVDRGLVAGEDRDAVLVEDDPVAERVADLDARGVLAIVEQDVVPERRLEDAHARIDDAIGVGLLGDLA